MIEDKTDTETHGEQMERYGEEVRQDEEEEDYVCLIYYKTGYVYGDERKQAQKAGYRVFDAEDMRRFLRNQAGPGSTRFSDSIVNTLTASWRKGATVWRNGTGASPLCSTSSCTDCGWRYRSGGRTGQRR